MGLQHSHGLIQFKCVVCEGSRLHIHAVVVQVQNRCLLLAEKGFVVEFTRLAAQLNQLEVESLNQIAVCLISELV